EANREIRERAVLDVGIGVLESFGRSGEEEIAPAVEGMERGERRAEALAVVGAEDFVTDAGGEGPRVEAEFEIVVLGLVIERTVAVVRLPGELGAVAELDGLGEGGGAGKEAAVGGGGVVGGGWGVVLEVEEVGVGADAAEFPAGEL